MFIKQLNHVFYQIIPASFLFRRYIHILGQLSRTEVGTVLVQFVISSFKTVLDLGVRV